MTDYISDSPIVARPWCPLCEPNRDPTVEILDTRYCDQHTLARKGLDDDTVVLRDYIHGSTEAGGQANRLWCQLLHRENNNIKKKKENDKPKSA